MVPPCAGLSSAHSDSGGGLDVLRRTASRCSYRRHVLALPRLPCGEASACPRSGVQGGADRHGPRGYSSCQPKGWRSGRRPDRSPVSCRPAFVVLHWTGAGRPPAHRQASEWNSHPCHRHRRIRTLAESGWLYALGLGVGRPEWLCIAQRPRSDTSLWHVFERVGICLLPSSWVSHRVGNRTYRPSASFPRATHPCFWDIPRVLPHDRFPHLIERCGPDWDPDRTEELYGGRGWILCRRRPSNHSLCRSATDDSCPAVGKLADRTPGGRLDESVRSQPIDSAVASALHLERPGRHATGTPRYGHSQHKPRRSETRRIVELGRG